MIALALAAWGAELYETDISATSVGVQFWQSSALREIEDAKTSSYALLLGQRLRWTLIGKPNFALRARAHGRFTLTPGADTFFKRNRVRQLGLSLITPTWTLDLGRHAVFKGGPRIFDGAQFVLHPSKVLDVGLWGGLIPDLFTTNPRLDRFGGGPVVGLTLSRVQVSVAGEVAVSDGIDRVAVLAQARASASRTIEVSGRADLELVGAYGLHLSDAQVFARWAPIRAFRADVTYNAFSSFTYQNTQAADPDLSRFQQRYLQDDPRLPDLIQNCVEPSLAHMVGADFRFHPQNDGIAPMASLSGRYRDGKDADELPPPGGGPACIYDDVNRYIRVHPAAGITGLPVGGALDLTVDANFYSIEGRTQMDAGLIVFWEPVDTGVLAVDASYRVLLNGYDGVKNPYGYQPLGEPNEGALGHYGDLFVDAVIPPIDLSVGLGVNVVSEPGDLAEDLGIATFARVTKYLRKRKKTKKSED